MTRDRLFEESAGSEARSTEGIGGLRSQGQEGGYVLMGKAELLRFQNLGAQYQRHVLGQLH